MHRPLSTSDGWGPSATAACELNLHEDRSKLHAVAYVMAYI